MKSIGRPLRMLVWSTCAVIVTFSFSAVSGTEDEWESISTRRESRALRLPGGSTLILAPHSKADYHSASSAVNLQTGRVDIDLNGRRDSVRISTSQVFIRESAPGGQFFVVSEPRQSTIGVCRGQVKVVANKGRSKSRSSEVAETGTITIPAGEQAVVKSSGETFRESDPPPTCEA